MTEKFIGQQLVADLYGCNRALLDDLDGIKQFIHDMCVIINTEIIEEAYHKFSPIGISAFAVITTSHFSIHTWPEFGYAAVDVFSCDGKLTLAICDHMQRILGATSMSTRMLDRHVTDAPAAAIAG